MVEEVGVEVYQWVAFYGREWRVCGEVEVVLRGREESEKVLFELKADEFF